MIHHFILTAGDWSRDGHQQIRCCLVAANKPPAAAIAALHAGCRKVGFWLVRPLDGDVPDDRMICNRYEERCIKRDAIEALAEHGIDIVAMLDEHDRKSYLEAPDHGTDASEYWERIAMEVMRLGDPDLRIEIVVQPEVRIGGYGLFF